MTSGNAFISVKNAFACGLVLVFGLLPGSFAACAQTVYPHEHHGSLIEDDIFGFTATTETGEKGDRSIGLENDGRWRKRDGRYLAFGSKLTAGYTFSENWWIGVAGFGDRHSIRGVSAQPVDLHRNRLDGGSVEIMHRFVSRHAGSMFAAAVGVEARWGTVDGGSGLRAQSSSAEFKMQLDAILIPDRLFWAGNLNWAPARQQDPLARHVWLRSSGTNISTALAVPLGESAAIAAEFRYQTQFEKLLPRKFAGQAAFLGPAFMMRLNDHVSFNAVFAMQVAGSAKAAPGQRFDLDNFERRIFRVALQAGF